MKFLLIILFFYLKAWQLEIKWLFIFLNLLVRGLLFSKISLSEILGIFGLVFSLLIPLVLMLLQFSNDNVWDREAIIRRIINFKGLVINVFLISTASILFLLNSTKQYAMLVFSLCFFLQIWRLIKSTRWLMDSTGYHSPTGYRTKVRTLLIKDLKLSPEVRIAILKEYLAGLKTDSRQDENEFFEFLRTLFKDKNINDEVILTKLGDSSKELHGNPYFNDLVILDFCFQEFLNKSGSTVTYINQYDWINFFEKFIFSIENDDHKIYVLTSFIYKYTSKTNNRRILTKFADWIINIYFENPKSEWLQNNDYWQITYENMTDSKYIGTNNLLFDGFLERIKNIDNYDDKTIYKLGEITSAIFKKADVLMLGKLYAISNFISKNGDNYSDQQIKQLLGQRYLFDFNLYMSPFVQEKQDQEESDAIFQERRTESYNLARLKFLYFSTSWKEELKRLRLRLNEVRSSPKFEDEEKRRANILIKIIDNYIYV